MTERQRRDALSLRGALLHLELHLAPQLIRAPPKRLRCNVLLEVHEMASAYYLIRLRLLALDETSHAGPYPVLVAASL